MRQSSGPSSERCAVTGDMAAWQPGGYRFENTRCPTQCTYRIESSRCPERPRDGSLRLRQRLRPPLGDSLAQEREGLRHITHDQLRIEPEDAVAEPLECASAALIGGLAAGMVAAVDFDD